MRKSSTALLLLSLAAFGGQPASDAAGWTAEGAKQFEQHEFTQAAASFQRAIGLDPNHAEAYKGLGMADMELKDYQGAYRAWLRASDLDPKDAKTKYYLGRLFYEADFPNEAAAWLRQALQLAPDDFAATTYLGLCAEALNLDDTAAQLYRKGLAESKVQGKPFSWAYLSYANYLKKHGDDAHALALLEEGAAKSPEAHELTAFGELLAAHAQPDRAEAVLRQAISLDETLSQPHYRLAILLKALNRPDEARAEMAKFQELKSREANAPKIMAIRK